jgi:hypothetical protein
MQGGVGTGGEIPPVTRLEGITLECIYEIY